MQYRVILHGTGLGKYCCRNINWIIKAYNVCIRADITLVVVSSATGETIAEDPTLLVGLGDKLSLSMVFMNKDF